MANIRVDSAVTIFDGQTLTFKSPVDCSQVTGLIVYYPDRLETASKVFQLTDANGNNVGNINNLFAADAIVKVVLDVDEAKAFVQNADTNAYLEAKLAEKYSPSNKPTAADVGAWKASGLKVNFGVSANTFMTEGSYICGAGGDCTAEQNAAINLPSEAGYFSVNVYATLHETNNGTVQVAYNRDSANIYTRRHVNSTWSGWKKIATTDYALPRDGSVAMAQALRSPNGVCVNRLWMQDWSSGEGIIKFYDRNGNGNRYIAIQDKTKVDKMSRALLFVNEKDNVYETYAVLHEGNKTDLVSFKTTATIPVSAWAEHGVGWKQTITVSGIKSSDKPIVGYVGVATQEGIIAVLESWRCVTNIIAYDGYMEIICDQSDKPQVDIPIQILCVR